MQCEMLCITVLTGAGVGEQGGFLTHVKVGNIESTRHKTQLVISANNIYDAIMHHIAVAKMILANPAPDHWTESMIQAYMPYKALTIVNKLGIQPEDARFDGVFVKKMIENADLVAKPAYGWLLDLGWVVCIAFMFMLVYWLAYSA